MSLEREKEKDRDRFSKNRSHNTIGYDSIDNKND